MMRNFKISSQVTHRNALSLDKYLRDISKIPLLSAKEEDELIGRINRDDRLALGE